jgi:hypothetical protein
VATCISPSKPPVPWQVRVSSAPSDPTYGQALICAGPNDIGHQKCEKFHNARAFIRCRRASVSHVPAILRSVQRSDGSARFANVRHSSACPLYAETILNESIGALTNYTPKARTCRDCDRRQALSLRRHTDGLVLARCRKTPTAACSLLLVPVWFLSLNSASYQRMRVLARIDGGDRMVLITFVFRTEVTYQCLSFHGRYRGQSRSESFPKTPSGSD